MKHTYCGDYIATRNYRRGDVVRMPSGKYHVFTHRGFIDVQAPVDHSLRGEKGEQGDPGEPGADGRDGVDGLDAVGFTLRGKWSPGNYAPLDVVTHHGSSFVAVTATKAEPPGKGWQLLASRGQRGAAGKEGATYMSRLVKHENTSNDIELAFLEDAYAGQAIYLENDDACGVANTLSRWRSQTAIGFAVNTTSAGTRGLVRTAGLIVVQQTLSPGWNYFLNGYGGLCTGVDGVAVAVNMGMAIRANTLLVRPDVMYATADTLTASGSGPKGAVVTLIGPTTVGLASMPDNWQWAGVLTADADGTATYIHRGNIVQDDWSAVLETGSELTPDTDYYLSDTPGKLTTDSEDRPYIGRALSATKFAVGFDSNEGRLVA